MQVTIGYSIPEQETTPSTAVIWGYAYGQRKRDRYSIECRAYFAD
jgi:hypothetical protein